MWVSNTVSCPHCSINKHFSSPVTSRQPREEERDGQNYCFVRREAMEKDIKEGRYLEHGEYDGNLYGTKIDSIHEVVHAGRTCILDVNPQVCWKCSRCGIDLVLTVYFLLRPWRCWKPLNLCHSWCSSLLLNWTLWELCTKLWWTPGSQPSSSRYVSRNYNNLSPLRSAHLSNGLNIFVSIGKWSEEDCGRERQDPSGLQPLLWPDDCQWQLGQGFRHTAGGCGAITHRAAVGSRQLGLLTLYLQTDTGARWPPLKSRHPKGRSVQCHATSSPSERWTSTPVWIWVLRGNCVTLIWAVRFLAHYATHNTEEVYLFIGKYFIFKTFSFCGFWRKERRKSGRVWKVDPAFVEFNF